MLVPGGRELRQLTEPRDRGRTGERSSSSGGLVRRGGSRVRQRRRCGSVTMTRWQLARMATATHSADGDKAGRGLLPLA
ncbi:uncharacterized protein DS421_16g537800 [Arachis hypogaea]|nr:uncharacterized protein DS421_16g537800 [Arachis hypogaea]